VPALAQTNVYSVNAVGYVNVVFPPGFSIRANPLNANPNTLANIFDTNVVVANSKIYQYVPATSTAAATFKIYTFIDEDGSKFWSAAATLNPGEGFFFNNPGAAFTNTFVGEVPQGPQSNQQVPQGFSIKSSVVPQSGQLDTVLQYPAAANDKVYRLNADGKTYSISTWIVEEPGQPGFWSKAPVPAVGEGFWLFSTSAKQWDRNFDVNK
jgi:hypothetical protein